MGLSNHHRALVSNLGEGNWGVGSGTENQLLNNGSVYFPPGASKGTEPVPGDSEAGPMSAFDLSGWGTKSNWIVQVNCIARGTGGSGTTVMVKVEAIRPTGLAETVLEVLANELADTTVYTYGGYESEKICGPVSYFKFTTQNFTQAGSPAEFTHDLKFYAIGWNEGDMCYGLAER